MVRRGCGGGRGRGSCSSSIPIARDLLGPAEILLVVRGLLLVVRRFAVCVLVIRGLVIHMWSTRGRGT
jgi:hypothetical protein